MTMTVPMTAITGERISIRAKKARWDRPVSKAIYARLRMKAEAMAQSVAQGPSFVDYVMGFIDEYLTRREVPHWTVHKAILGYFHALKDDIDKAIERCRRARMRAAERKAEKEAARMREMAEDTLQAEEIDADSSNETGGTTGKSKGRKTKSHKRQKYGNHRWINTITLLFNSLRDKYIFHRQKVPIIR